MNEPAMNTQEAQIGLVAAILILTTAGLRAQPASGSYTGTFNGGVGLWDISGDYSEDVGGLPVEYYLSMDPSGKFVGRGRVSLPGSYWGLSLDADLSFVGTIKTVGNVTRVSMTLKMKGGREIEGSNFTFSATATENLLMDTQNLQLSGRVTGSESMSIPALHEHMRVPFRSDVQTDLPAGMDGTWNLTLDLSPNGNNYGGTGSVLLSNGSTIPLKVNGSYVAGAGISKLALTGKGVNLSLTGPLKRDSLMSGA